MSRPPADRFGERALFDELIAAQARFASLEAAASIEPPSGEVVEKAVAELKTTLEELATVAEQLGAENAELARMRESASAHLRRYEELFQLAPEAYLVTNSFGTIREANEHAAAIFGIPQRFLGGKPLPNLVCGDDRRDFRAALAALPLDQAPPLPWAVTMVRRNKERFRALVSVSVTQSRPSATETLRWLVRDLQRQDENREQEGTALRPGCDDRAAYLEERLRATTRLAAQLQTALSSRIVIEQAKGRIMERAGLDAQEAFDTLRGYARRNGLRLHEVSNDIAQGRLRLPQ